jgi:hypothetical protein
MVRVKFMRSLRNMNAHSEPPVDVFAGFEGGTAESHLMHVSGARRTSR